MRWCFSTWYSQYPPESCTNIPLRHDFKSLRLRGGSKLVFCRQLEAIGDESLDRGEPDCGSDILLDIGLVVLDADDRFVISEQVRDANDLEQSWTLVERRIQDGLAARDQIIARVSVQATDEYNY